MPQKHGYGYNLYSLFYKTRRKISEATAAYWTDLEVYSSLQEAQADIAENALCLKRTQTITTVANTQEYNLYDNSFSDIIDVSKDGTWFLRGGTKYFPLIYKEIKDLNVEFPGWQGVVASTPMYYYYDKATKVVGLSPKPNATNAGAYLFLNGFHKPKILHAGTATAGTTSSITLQAGSATAMYPSTTNDYYNDLYIEIYGGTGAGQRAKITDYVASTRVVTATFTTAPDATSIYGMVPQIPEEAHNLMYLYAVADCWEKGGTRSALADRYWRRYYDGLASFAGDMETSADENIIKESYRA